MPVGPHKGLAGADVDAARDAALRHPVNHEFAVMTENDIPNVKIEFPCERYPIKVIGEAGDDFVELVIEVFLRHAPDLDRGTLVLRDSRTGKFQTVQLLITATSIEQLEALHGDLRATGRVHMVL